MLGLFLRSRRQRIERATRSLGPYLRFPGRVGKAVTQEEMAEALGVTRQWYAVLEADGARASAALLDRLSGVFALSPHERLELFQLAIPEFGTLDAAERERLPLLEALAFPRPIGTELIISSPSEIESTARRLDKLREAFLTRGQLQRNALRPRIAHSWSRSQAANVDAARTAAPIAVESDIAIFELREENERFLCAAEPVIRYLVDELAGSGYAVILTDRGGCVLHLEGDLDIRRRLVRLGLEPGGQWSEAMAGTNAIGTALADGRPLQLMAAEHFCEGWQSLTCTASPVRDPRTGEIVGALDITASYTLIRPHLLALIMQCALAIEEELARLSDRQFTT